MVHFLHFSPSRASTPSSTGWSRGTNLGGSAREAGRAACPLSSIDATGTDRICPSGPGWPTSIPSCQERVAAAGSRPHRPVQHPRRAPADGSCAHPPGRRPVPTPTARARPTPSISRRLAPSVSAVSWASTRDVRAISRTRPARRVHIFLRSLFVCSDEEFLRTIPATG